MTTINKIFGAVALAAIASAIILLGLYRNSREQVSRLSGNQAALLSEIEHRKTQDGANVATIQRLQMTVGEFEEQCSGQKEEIERLGIRIKDLRQVINADMSIRTEIVTQIHDSIIMLRDTVKVVKCFDYNDGWVTANGCVDSTGTLTAQIESCDTLDIIARNVPKRFLFFKWGSKRIELDIINRNPHAEINHARWIEFTK